MSKIVIVTGPPLGGKSTYVEQNMGENDVRFDYDEYQAAVCNLHNREEASEAQKSILFRLRSCLVSICKDDDCKVEKCLQIATKISESLKEAAGDNAEVVEVEATEEECLERLEKDDKRKDKEK